MYPLLLTLMLLTLSICGAGQKRIGVVPPVADRFHGFSVHQLADSRMQNELRSEAIQTQTATAQTGSRQHTDPPPLPLFASRNISGKESSEKDTKERLTGQLPSSTDSNNYYTRQTFERRPDQAVRGYGAKSIDAFVHSAQTQFRRREPQRGRPVDGYNSYGQNQRSSHQLGDNFVLKPDPLAAQFSASNGRHFVQSANSYGQAADQSRTVQPYKPQQQSRTEGGRQFASHINAFTSSRIDTSDPCFRRYANCIIVNAQPYERRSTTTLSQCKSHCLSSQTGIYSCMSFVFDNINQVCDLFAHLGNQPPARLLLFQGRDYFEPTGVTSGCGGVAVIQTSPTETFVTEEDHTSNKKLTTETPSDETEETDHRGSSCKEGEIVRYLRIEGFELQDHDDVLLEHVTVDQCLKACTDNKRPNGAAAPCQSFDFGQESCTLTREAGVPLGNGQLTQSASNDYYEKICVQRHTVSACPQVFDRFPQMILVGFAETVVDASTFEQCLNNCLNSQQLYGFGCISGMFYFEEPQLNCILNTEDRQSQPDLFTEENVDIVDYFETGCASTLTRFRSSRRQLASRRSQSRKVVGHLRDAVSSRPEKERGEEEWTEWTECDRGRDGRRVRYKRCERTPADQCPLQTQWCNRHSPPRNILNVDALNYARKLNESHIHSNENRFQCPLDVCCAIFGGCRVGLRQSSSDHKIRWCTNPCELTKT